jgi:GT2 family glycosyltransferase
VPKISVILVEYRNHEYTKRCKQSIAMTGFEDLEVITIDNSHNNRGLAAAQNLGAKIAKGKYLFFLNNDTVVHRDIFKRLLENGADVMGCRMFDYLGKRELDSCISVDRFGCPSGNTGPMFYPDGAIFIKRSVFEEVGGFDDKLFLYGEDRDLCWRVLLAGYSIGFNTRAVFYHNSTSVNNGTNSFRRFTSERNIIRSILKNYSLKNLPSILIQYSFWSILEIGLILLTNPKMVWKCYLKAYWWNIINFRDTIRMRRRVIRRVKDKDLPFSKVIGKLYVLKTIGIPKWVGGRYA